MWEVDLSRFQIDEDLSDKKVPYSIQRSTVETKDYWSSEWKVEKYALND